MFPLAERVAERIREHKEGPGPVKIQVEPNKPGSFNADGEDPNDVEGDEAHFDKLPGQSKLRDTHVYKVEGDDTIGHSSDAAAARDATAAADAQRAQQLQSGAGGNGGGAGSPFPVSDSAATPTESKSK